jgi:hypothetical protein
MDRSALHGQLPPRAAQQRARRASVDASVLVAPIAISLVSTQIGSVDAFSNLDPRATDVILFAPALLAASP